ncbi:MAG: hypothetical protein IIA64_06690 [Planctomycetes bacterium]|nr:hypothetical protein [Planctomycetota bacterium]
MRAASKRTDDSPGAPGLRCQWHPILIFIVADSVPQREFDETVHKAAGLGRAIDLAESAFGS